MLTAKGLAYHYEEGGGEHLLFENLDISLEAGERVALVGASGCGKSTLLNLLGAIDSPSAGSICFDSHDIARLPEPERTLFRRRNLGFVYQRFLLVPTLTVAENVRLPLDLLEVPTAEALARTQAALAEVGLAARADSFPDRMSGGEQQRVAIARALIHRPQLVLADEPTGSLDSQTAEPVLELLLAQAKRNDGALLLVTHSEDVARRADRVLLFEQGCVRER
ncbi:MAG: ABC transporter ATP-binding protein [Pseudomonadota bacterium]